MNVLGAIVTLAFGLLMAGWMARLTNRAMRKVDKIDAVFQPLPGKIVRVVIIVFTLIAVLNRFGVETTSLIALLGAAGLAIGLALQGTLSNVAAGVMILLFRPFKIGDVIKLGDDDIDKAIGILKGIVAAEPRVLNDPAPLVQVESLGDSSVNILLRVWTARTDW